MVTNYNHVAQMERLARELGEHGVHTVAIITDFANLYASPNQKLHWMELAREIELAIKKVNAGMSAWLNAQLYEDHLRKD